ncbi:MAG: S-adenosylmethionine:tRNA ribosyltransferase-isomerase [Candidatus Kapaibacterium sp.]
MNNRINIEEYNYELLEDRIAQKPLPNRSSSKLLVYDKGIISEKTFRDINECIPEDSFLIFNDTKVINARIFFRKETGAKIEIFCLEPIGKSIEKAFECTDKSDWNCMVGNASKWRDEILAKNFTVDNTTMKLFAEKTGVSEEGFSIKFYWEGGFSFSEVMSNAGTTPLPPYIKRKAEISDEERYQTVFADTEGSVAAPTAGLHFTREILTSLNNRNILYDFITLNVGAGTFKPMKTNDVYEHRMHREIFTVRKSFLENLLKCIHKKKTAIGTTSVRTLESLYWLGVLAERTEKDEFAIEQWEVYDYMNKELPEPERAIKNLLALLEKRGTDILEGSTSLMIIPGYKFKLVDILVTNFHLPSSTLILLVSAFTGSDWKKIYDYALKNDFRFLSYGDSSIIIPQT